MRWLPFLLVGVSIVVSSATAGPPTVSPETTYYLEPLDDEGYVDYAAALNAAFGDAEADLHDNAFLGILEQVDSPDWLEGHVAAMYAELGVTPPADAGPRFVRFDDYAEALGLPRAPPFDWGNAAPDAEAPPPPPGTADAMEERAYGRPWTADELPEVAAWLDSIQTPLDAIAQATQRPAYYAPLVRPHEHATVVEVILPHLSTHRAIARSLSMRARRHLGVGNLEAAIKDWATLKRLAQLQKREPVLISNLVGISIQALSHDVFNLIVSQPGLTAAHVESMYEVLVGLPAGVSMHDVIHRAERVGSLDLITRASRGQARVLDVVRIMQEMMRHDESRTYYVNEPGPDPVTALLSHPDFELEVALTRINAAWDRWFGEIPADFADFIERQEQIEAEIEALATQARQDLTVLLVTEPDRISLGADRDQIAERTANLMLSILTPALSSAIKTERQSQAQASLEPVGLALAAYQIDHGNFPPLLQSLVPDYLEAMPADPLGNKSLRYRRQASGYLLYSVGTNLTDDSGIHDLREGDIVLAVPWSATE